MHITLDDAFAGLGSAELRAHSEILEVLLIHHLQGHHLLVLNPRQILAISSAIQFSGLAGNALAIVSRKAQGYHASMREAERVVVVQPLAAGGAVRQAGSRLYVTPQWLGPRLAERPRLFLENAINDGRFYGRVLELAAPSLSFDPTFVCLKPVHGGGGTLAAVLEELHGPQIAGVCICDRDHTGTVPPFRRHTTGEHAFEALVRMNALNPDGSPHEENPLFHFKPTAGWSVENYIGPNLLDVYFQNNHSALAHRNVFTNAFPNFPTLSEDEMLMWLTCNFRSAAQEAGDIESGLQARTGAARQYGTHLERVATLTLPDGALAWTTRNFEKSRWTSDLRRAFEADRRSDIYNESVELLAKTLHTLLAADATLSIN